MFNIGDKVVYPMHGAGIIEDIEEKRILGEMHNYYILKLPTKNMKVMLPVDNIETLGVRNIIEATEIKAVMSILKGEQSVMSTNWNRRYRNNMEKVKSGNIMDVAEVVRDLQILDIERGLSTGERKMLSNTKQILISEMALVQNKEKDEIEDIIDDAITSTV